MARKRPGASTTDIAKQAAMLADFVNGALAAAERLHLTKMAVEHFPLEVVERALVADLPTLSATLMKKLGKKNATFTVAETASMVMAMAIKLQVAEPLKQQALLFIAMKLMECLEQMVVRPRLPKKKEISRPTDAVFQFKITLLGAKPTIWRRILVQDCTLDKLHEHIQTAMGWTNSHLHHFRIGEQLYGDPMLMEENMEDMDYKDSTTTLLSVIVPKSGKRFRFLYEYDFGDGWEHEVLFEGAPKAEAGRKYPLCLEGDRACPPEDCGGVGGYADFLEAIGNKKHEQHEEMLEWVGGQFDPEEFDAAAATKSMKKGLPDWRSML